MKLKNKGHKITAVAPGSIGEELELEPGDVLLTIDGEEIEDIFDYDYMTDSESFVMTVPVFRRSTRKVPSFSSRHFFISFPASRFFLYLQQIFNALLGLFLLKKFF